MNESNAYELLRSVRQQLAGYRVAQCALAHERVVSLSRNAYGTSPDHPGWQIGLKGFCDSSTRLERLGCAHTRANDHYRNLVSKLIKAGIADGLVAPLAEIDATIMAIYRTDHEKGSLDKRCAVLREQGKTPELQEAERKLNAVLATHFKLVERLEALHRHILTGIDALLAERMPSPAE
ncbi:MAG: hypothetical protein SXG53_26115 [Pseudomonadota bacterium]|nr:hypothetical protein [Pseudomonadota bacterium]